MITSDEQISPPSLVCKEYSLHLHYLCVGILFKFTALGHSFMQNFATLQFKTRLGGEICSFDVNMGLPIVVNGVGRYSHLSVDHYNIIYHHHHHHYYYYYYYYCRL